jgi:hypothetical protein
MPTTGIISIEIVSLRSRGPRHITNSSHYANYDKKGGISSGASTAKQPADAVRGGPH